MVGQESRRLATVKRRNRSICHGLTRNYTEIRISRSRRLATDEHGKTRKKQKHKHVKKSKQKHSHGNKTLLSEPDA